LSGISKAILWLALGGFAIRAGAASITNTSCADTSLLEIEPTHNNGGQAFTISGHIQNPFLTRALYRFDVGSLPTNTRIQSVVLELAVTDQPGDGQANSNFGLHRMLRPWGEGDKVVLGPHAGQGLPATAGEATWSHSFYPTNAWAEPGGASGVDFVGGESSYQTITDANASYRFLSTPELVDDVQGWVSNPQSNFGWILISDDEGTPFTARHFGSREDPSALPALEIDYLILVAPRIESARQVGNQFELQFTAEAGQTYVVEYRAALTNGIWQTLTNLGRIAATSSVRVLDDLSEPHRFYRLNSY
jgi:hypothetical protein